MISTAMVITVVAVLLISLILFVLLFEYKKLVRSATLQFFKKMGILLVFMIVVPGIECQEYEDVPEIDMVYNMDDVPRIDFIDESLPGDVFSERHNMPVNPVMLPSIDMATSIINKVVNDIFSEQSMIDKKNRDFLDSNNNSTIINNSVQKFGDLLYIS